MKGLLVSTYESGHQPLGLAAPAAALRARGHDVRCIDLAVESPEAAEIAEAALVGISIPMHSAARLGIALARRVRLINPDAHIAFYGLYASPLSATLLERTSGDAIADSVHGGEYEPSLCDLADAVEDGLKGGTGRTNGTAPETSSLRFDRQQYPLPDRAGLPPLDAYARVQTVEGTRLAGYVEATHGCAHTCDHCPITPVYGGRQRLVQPETVLADIDQQVALGARHITFGDPDFLNAVPHSMAIIEAMVERHPSLTFDVTVKVEHLLEHAAVLPRLREAGCLFITSAFESCSDAVLGYLDTGHTRAQMDQALALATAEGLTIRPTWLAFTPWCGVEDYVEMLNFIESCGLVGHVQPVQYALRLLLPPGSPLVPLLDKQGLLGPYDGDALTYGWTNADARIDPLQREVATIVEDAAVRCTCDDDANAHLAHDIETFTRVKRASLAALGRGDQAVIVAKQPQQPPPRLTEDWFC
ncbi:MAG TPA: CUAEP/CCAEP-tail radical SAM protein [Dehalococcoidia bacterium]|nr:CUAEP/CCAEP-tail radical SAM protein [Dehalococcoidia bacterium]